MIGRDDAAPSRCELAPIPITITTASVGRRGRRRAIESRKPPDRRPLVDIRAIAEYLGDSERHVRRLVAERRIPHVKVGRLLRFDQDEIDEWIDDHRRPARL